MKKFLLLALLLTVVSFSYAQKGIGTIVGRVMDSSLHSPLEYATISLYKKGSKTPVDGTTANSSGRFQLLNIAPGLYKVVADFIGYRPVTINDVEVNNNVVDLKIIELPKKAESLQAVVVTAQGNVIENKIDKMVFNAEKDLTSQTGVATDVLKKVPQVSVDVDGNVELAGSSSIRFLINGKPSSAFGSSITDVLQSIPASQIKSIEIITNPGAKYDAQGLGGIINIILKNNTAKGVNGNLSLSAGTRQNNGSFNFNARKGKLGFNAFVSGNLRPYANTPTTYDRTSTDSLGNKVLLHQDGSSRYTRYSYQTGIGFDYTINEKNSITGSLSFEEFTNKSDGSINQVQTSSYPFVTSIASLNNTNSKLNIKNVDASISYKKTFAKDDQELDIQALISDGYNHGLSSNLQYYMPQDSLYYGTDGVNPGKDKVTQAQVDYTQPLKKDVLLGVGGKVTIEDIISNSDVLTYHPATKIFSLDNYLTNSLNYHQKIYAAYSELTFPVGKLFDAKVGGRYERTDINANYSNAQNVEIPSYNTFVPSVFFSKQITDDQLIKLSYSKRIERPDFRSLNPFINTSDPKNLTAGNPYLQPEIGNRYELGYTKNFGKVGSFMASLFYRTSNHDIQSYVVYYPSLKVGDSVYTNVSLSTRQNIGIEKDLGLNLFADLHLFSKLNVRTNFFVFRRNTLNTIDPGYNAQSVNFRSNINASYQFGTNVAAEFFGNFNSARHEVQGTYPSFTSYSFALRKQFWNKNGSLALTAVNPFSEYVSQTTMLHGPNFTVISNRKIPFRSFGLNFTWKFGKLQFKKNKDNNNGVDLNLPGDQ